MTGPGLPPSDADHLRLFVADRDAPCPSCGYNLRGLTTTLCPECSQALVLRVGLVEPRLGIWIAALIGAAAGAGFNALLLGYVMLEITVRGRPMPGRIFDGFVVCNGIGLLVMGGALAALVRCGRRFRRSDRPTQLLLTALVWAAAVSDLIMFFVNVS